MYAYSAKIPAVRERIKEKKDDFALIESHFKQALGDAWSEFSSFLGKNCICLLFSCFFHINWNSVEWPPFSQWSICRAFQMCCISLWIVVFQWWWFGHVERMKKVRWMRECILVWNMQWVQEELKCEGRVSCSVENTYITGWERERERRNTD